MTGDDTVANVVHCFRHSHHVNFILSFLSNLQFAVILSHLVVFLAHTVLFSVFAVEIHAVYIYIYYKCAFALSRIP